MAREIVTALYKPKEGQDEALRALIGRHVKTLRGQGLATDRPSVVMRSYADGTYLEVFEWTSHEAAQKAHQDPVVQEIWGKMGAVADFVTLAELQESTAPFPHFAPEDRLSH